MTARRSASSPGGAARDRRRRAARSAPAYAPGPGRPAVENAGVVPDVEVEAALVEPSAEPDPQLAAAIAAIQAQLSRRAP